MRRAFTLTAVAVALGAPTVASADERIVAGAGNRYLTTTPSIDQGELLTFQNQDVSRHDVTATNEGPDQRPLFASALIGQGQEAEVVGARYLTTGSYGFFCTIHPFMTGTLTVTSAGTPLPRPGGGEPPPASGDMTPPRLGARIARRVSRGRLPVELTSDEASSVTVSATARVGRRTVRLAGARASLSAGSPRTVRLRLSSSARRALRGEKRATVTATVTGTDAAGNRGRAASTRRVTL